MTANTDWNTLVTAHRRESWKAAQQLKRWAALRKTEFRDVLVGKVENIQVFLEGVLELCSAAPGKPLFIPSFSRIIPLEHVFEFTPETIIGKLKEFVTGWLPQLTGTFDVRMERRGLKGAINSQQIENDIRTFVQEQNQAAKLELENPEKIIVIETLGSVAGVGLLTAEQLQKYPFVRVE